MFSKLEKGFVKTVVPASSFPEKWLKVFSKQEARFFPNYFHWRAAPGDKIWLSYSTEINTNRLCEKYRDEASNCTDFSWILQPLQAHAPFIQYLSFCCEVLALTQLQTWALIKTFQVAIVQIALCCGYYCTSSLKSAKRKLETQSTYVSLKST